MNIFPLLIPPLRERKEDIDILARHLVEQYAREYHHPINRIEAGYIEKLHSYHWPGNVRELENVIARSILKTEKTAASLSANSIETKIAVPKSPAPLPPTNSTHDYRGNYQDSFTEWEKNLIETSFSRNRKNKTDTAQELGISIRSLYDKIRKYKLQ